MGIMDLRTEVSPVPIGMRQKSGIRLELYDRMISDNEHTCYSVEIVRLGGHL